jgi:DNA ligase-1
MQKKYEIVEEGKQSRTLKEQIMSRMASRISKQRDKGYVDSIDKIGSKIVNTLGLPKPMLAKKFKDVKGISFEHAFVQPKYDGNRCLITKQNGEVFAYSRNGKVIDSIDHITSSLDLDEGDILDGELYAHGERLQTIVSWIKRKQEDTKRLKYHLYDYMIEAPYAVRFPLAIEKIHSDAISVTPTFRVLNEEDTIRHFKHFREQEYEGAILRWGKTGYEDNKRSNSLVKIKEWIDEEFEVVDIHIASDGWGVLECVLPSGDTFRVSAPGSIAEKMEVADNPERYVGKIVTVEYAQLTRDGIPFHPVATRWRKDV